MEQAFELLLFQIFFRNPINRLRQSVVFVGHYTSCIVGVQLKMDGVPHIRPIGMVVLFFGKKGYLGHKGKCFCEIFKLKSSLEGIVFFGPHSLKCGR